MSKQADQLAWSRFIGGWPLLVMILPFIVVSAVASVALCIQNDCPSDEELEQILNGKNTTKPNRQTKVFGGEEIRPGEFPFLVSIDYKCAGAIIGPYHILTSAECVENYYWVDSKWATRPLDFMNVFVGEHYRSETEQDGESRVDIVDIKINPGYKRTGNNSKLNNIALLKTRENMFYAYKGASFNPVGSIKMACEPVPDGAHMLVVGWGAGSYADGHLVDSPVPKKLEVSKLSQNICRCYLKKYGITLPEKTLCASPELESGTICVGDSGGPLFQLTEKNGLQLVGIASLWRSPCKQAKVPAVYTQVSDYMDWILENQT